MSDKINYSMCAMEGDIAALSEAIKNDPNLVNHVDEDGRTLLFWAASGKQFETLQYLISKGAKLDVVDEADWTVLHIAASTGNLPIVKEILNLNKDLINKENEKGQTALFYSVSKDHAQVTELLLNEGASVNHIDNLGQTALFRTVKHDNIKLAQLLHSHNARLKIYDKTGSSLLHLACEEDNQELALWLVNKELDADRANKQGKSPLDLAPPHLKKVLQKAIDEL